METITSAQNPKIKNLLLLQEKSRERREQGLFVVEGRRELEHCLEGGFKVRTLFVCPEILDATSFLRHLPLIEASVIEIPEQLYRKVAYRDSTEGIIAEVEYKSLSLADLQLPEHPLIMVQESVEKPGNLGAVLRSADAAGADAVLICDPLTDLYNPNLIRASIGAVFTVPTVAVSSEKAIDFLKAHDIQILTAQLQDSSLYYDVDMRRGTALVMGTESTGLTPVWRQAADTHIRIPMLGRLDSLNVSVSASILLFEAVRQRQ
jgi:TrmH family RNA methyltransferase